MDRRKLPLTGIALTLLLATFATSAGAAIHRWVDAQGHVHFDDQAEGPSAAPPGRAAPAPSPAANDRLSVRVTAHGWDLSPAGRAQLDDGVHRIFDVYSGLFHLDMRRQVDLDIHLFPDLDAMRAQLATQAPSMSLPGGVLGLYAPTLDAIYVWRHDEDEKRVIATLLHESSHVMVDRLAPNAPPWLQEGLAQYFQGLDPELAEGEDTRIVPEPNALAAIDAMVRQRQLVTLRDYFSLSPDRWRHLAYAEQNPIPYPVAWSVTYFLMSKPVGRQIVGSLLQDMEKTRRAPTEDTIHQRYPGGYPMMEYDWFKWAQQPKQPQVLRW